MMNTKSNNQTRYDEGKDDHHGDDDHCCEYDDFLMFFQDHSDLQTYQVLDNGDTNTSRNFKLGVRDESYSSLKTSISKFCSSPSYYTNTATTRRSNSPPRTASPSCSENNDLTDSTAITPIDQIVRLNNLSSCPKGHPKIFDPQKKTTSPTFDQLEEDDLELRPTIELDEFESNASTAGRQMRDEQEGVFDCIELDDLPFLMIPDLRPLPEEDEAAIATQSFAFVDKTKQQCSLYSDDVTCATTTGETGVLSASRRSSSIIEQGSEEGDHPRLFLTKEESHSYSSSEAFEYDDENHWCSVVHSDALLVTDHIILTPRRIMNHCKNTFKLRPKRGY